MKNRGDVREAATLMEVLAEQYPDDWRIQYYTGTVYLFDLERPAEAIPLCRKAVQLRPRSERASLALFHALWGAGQQVEALDEVKRFQGVSHSADYDAIVAELAEG
jgi:tetratricopeptide (TPR) repeat protein